MAAMISFSLCNICLGELSTLGIKSIDYYCTGALIFALAYLIKQREWAKRNPSDIGMLDEADRPEKVILRTWDNEFDWWSLFIIFVGACY